MFYKHRKTLGIIIFLILCIIVFTKCISKQNNQQQETSNNIKNTDSVFKNPVITNELIGSIVCADCHKSISHNYIHTAHYLTSQPATKQTIKGNFVAGKNYYAYRPDRVVVLESRDSGLYQVYYSKNIEKLARRFDVVVGSGTKGQTYLTWVGDQLIELPVSYFTLVKNWENSPGYPLSPIIFNRLVTTRCLECHATLATTATPPMQEPERFDSTKILLTIGCEKCHGPAKQHVEFEKLHPNDTTGKYIINPAKLALNLQLDVCNLCHSGRLQKTQPSFSFIAGDTLANYFALKPTGQNPENIDVHGNQFGLLANSKCYTISKTLVCTNCHNVHENERDNMRLFSQRCVTCHTQTHKEVDGITAKQLVNNCIDCHMPKQPSHSIEFILQGDMFPTPAIMRTHYIKVYPDATQQYIASLKNKRITK